MDLLIRFVQEHESFRQPELEALSALSRTDVETIYYAPDSPFCKIKLSPRQHNSSQSPDSIAANFISNSFLSKGIYELWAQAQDYPSLHDKIKSQTQYLWPKYLTTTFKFTVDPYCGKRSMSEQREIIDTFSYLGFKGKINLKKPEAHFVVFEEWDDDTGAASLAYEFERNRIDGDTTQSPYTQREPKQIYFCRFIGGTRRRLADNHDLKKRPYISTTSMDALLALVTANFALAGPGKLVLDPFVGTGGFMVAASELGAISLGSDIDGRSFRGKGKGMHKGVGANFKHYKLQHLFGDCITSDLTNTPFRLVRAKSSAEPDSQTRQPRYLDAIISDPPYGVREGLKVLGLRISNHGLSAQTGTDPTETQPSTHSTNEPQEKQAYLIDGVPAHLLPGYIAPKKPYSFEAMLDDILSFAANTLVDGGRLAFWMPSINEAFDERLGEEKVKVRDRVIEEQKLKNGTSDSKVKAHPEPNLTPEPEPESNLTPELEPEPDSKIPTHPHLTLKHICTQSFSKWSRKLLVYERIKGNPHHETSETEVTSGSRGPNHKTREKADDLNAFRRAYFRGFQGG